MPTADLSLDVVALRARLSTLRTARLRIEFDRSRVNTDLAETVRALVDRGVSQREVADTLNVSSVTVHRYMDPGAARMDPEASVPVIDLGALGEVLEAFGPVERLLVAFHEEDVVVRTGLSPGLFAVGGRVYLPHALLTNARREWLGVQDCLCGYGGTGAHNTLSLLAALDLDPERLQRTIFRNRFIDLDVTSSEVRSVASDPISRIDLRGALVVDGVVIAGLGRRNRGSYLDPPPAERDTRRQHDGEGNTLSDWRREILDREPVVRWAEGPRSARCYLSYEAVRRAGLDHVDQWDSWWPTVVVEQGDLQLWCPAGLATHWSELLSPDAVGILEQLALAPPPLGLAERLRRLAPGATRPDYVDLGELCRDPADLLRGAER